MIRCHACGAQDPGSPPVGFIGPDERGVYWRGTQWFRYVCMACSPSPALGAPYADLARLLAQAPEEPGTGCFGCDARRAALTPEDRARIPLRQAANRWGAARDRLFDLVQAHGWHDPRVKEQDAILDAADDAFAAAARVFAKERPEP